MKSLFAVILASTLLIAASRTDSSPAFTCPAIVATALEATDNRCSGIGRNQACYGNAEIEAEPQTGVSQFAFLNEGDVVDAGWIRSLRLSAMNPNTGAWGVSLMRLQANLPDTLPGQNVTFLVFGDVQIENQVSSPIGATVLMGTTEPVSLRSTPGADGDIVATVAQGMFANATGRLADNSWFLLEPDLGGGDAGWASATQLFSLDDANRLPIVDPVRGQAVDPRSPMQAFRLQTNNGPLGCADVPSDGLLIQTPHGAGRVQLQVNGVNVELGSTVFFQATPGGNLSITTLEGLARVESMGFVQYAVPGTTVNVPLSQDLVPSAPPSNPISYDVALLEPLPLQLLDRPVRVRPPLGPDHIAAAAMVAAQDGDLCGAAPLEPCAVTTAYAMSYAPAQWTPSLGPAQFVDPIALFTPADIARSNGNSDFGHAHGNGSGSASPTGSGNSNGNSSFGHSNGNSGGGNSNGNSSFGHSNGNSNGNASPVGGGGGNGNSNGNSSFGQSNGNGGGGGQAGGSGNSDFGRSNGNSNGNGRP